MKHPHLSTLDLGLAHLIPAALVAALLFPSATAATYTWDPAGSSGATPGSWTSLDGSGGRGNWAVTGNSSHKPYPGQTPADGDTAVFPTTPVGASNVSLDSTSISIANLTLQNTTAVAFSSGTLNISSTITKSGAGSVIFNSGVNIGGTPSLSVASGSGQVFFNTPTTLGNVTGSGSIGGSITINGTHNVANGTTQTFGNLTYGDGSIFAWNLSTVTTDPGNGASNQGTYDRVNTNVLSAATGTETFQVILGGSSFTDAFWDTNKSWTNVFSVVSTGTIASVFDTFGGSGVATDGTVAGQGQFSLSGNTLNWTSSAIPEPTSALAGVLLGFGLIRRRR